MVECADFKPTNICMEVVFGTDTQFEAVLTDGKGDPVNIAADEVEFTVRDKPQGTIKIAKSNVAGTHADPANGRTGFTIAATDYTDTPTSDQFFWVYEVRRILSTGKQVVHIEGNYTVSASVGGQP